MTRFSLALKDRLVRYIPQRQVCAQTLPATQFGTPKVKQKPSLFAVLPSLVVPVCLGLSLYLGLQWLIDKQHITDETALRYLTAHPVSKITIAMFFVGLASLGAIAWNVLVQFASEKDIHLEELSESNDTQSIVPGTTTPAVRSIADQAADYGQQLYQLPKGLHGHYLWDRLVNALHSIYRTGSTSNLEDELKYLSENDQFSQQQRYSLVRILIWATPMLGFLGTVLGISQALGGIDVGPDKDFQAMMDGLRGNLYVAFDTTALALTLSIGLMFALFLLEKFESQLLRLVDQRANRELTLYFENSAAGDAPGSNIVDAVNQMVESQTDIWRKTIQSAEKAWSSSLTDANALVQDNLSESLDENVAALAHYLGESIEKADQAMAHRWSQWQITLSDNARQIERWQDSLHEQTKAVQHIVASIEDSASLKNSLRQQQEIVDTTTRVHDVLTQVFQAADAQQQKQTTADSDAELILPMQADAQQADAQQADSSSSFAETPSPTPEPIGIFKPHKAPAEIQAYVEPDEEELPTPTPVKRFQLPQTSESVQVFVRKKPADKKRAA